MPHWRRWSDSYVGILATAGAAVAWGLGVELATAGASSVDVWLPDTAVGLALVAAGTIASWNDRRRWAGRLLVLAGMTWFFGNLAGHDPAWIGSFGERATFIHRGVLLSATLVGTRRRAAQWYAAAAVASTLIDPLMVRPGGMILWSAVAAAGAAYFVSEQPRGRRKWRFAAIAALVSTVAATAGLFTAFGSSPAPRGSVTVYQAGIAVTAVLVAAGTVAERLRVDRLADAVIEVALGPEDRVRDMLAEALRDPDVTVVFAGADGWVDELGRPSAPPTASAGRGVVDIVVGSDLVAQLSCAADVAAQRQAIDAVEIATTLAAYHARLRADLRRQAGEMERSRRRVLLAADEQRVQITGALEAATATPLGQLDDLLALVDADDDVLSDIVQRSRKRLAALTSDLNSLAAGLGPAALREGDLRRALSELVSGYELAVELRVDPTPLPRHLVNALYFVCAEAVTNTVKHAAASRLWISAGIDGGDVWLVVADDGRGGAQIDEGHGLRGLTDRVAALDGTLNITSPLGDGTRLSVIIPRRRECVPP